MASETRRPKYPRQEVYSFTEEMADRVHDLAVDLGESKSGAARIIMAAGLKRLDELEDASTD